jgi:hypothetical protein
MAPTFCLGSCVWNISRIRRRKQVQ